MLSVQDGNDLDKIIYHPVVRKHLWVLRRYVYLQKHIVTKSYFIPSVFSNSFILTVTSVYTDFHISQNLYIYIYIKPENNYRKEIKISTLVVLAVVLLQIDISWKGKPRGTQIFTYVTLVNTRI